MASPRFMISALSGKSGKTVITLGLLRLLSQRGLKVQPFKKGPDYIDPGWHRVACNRVSWNLDSFFMTPEQILCTYAEASGGCDLSANVEASEGCDLSTIEGAMGLFDGLDTQGSSSSAEIAKITQSPVILVVDTTRMTRTVAALILGCQHFDPEVQIAGVILNRVRGQRHEQLMRDSIAQYCGIPVLGAIRVDERLDIPDRHLGLLSAEEAEASDAIVEGIAEVIAEHVDIDALLALAGTAPDISSPKSAARRLYTGSPEASAARPRIAVIRDPAFCFYYEENLLALKQQGAELLFINSLKDHALPGDIHALYIGGGFPEEFAAQLQGNQGLRKQIGERIEQGIPVYAEGGGLMYLGRTLTNQEGSYQMVGSLQLDTVIEEQRQAHGYVEMETTGAVPWLEAGSTLKGHAYHYGKLVNVDPTLPLAFAMKRGQGIDGSYDGVCYKEVLATIAHIHAAACPLWAEQLVDRARDFLSRTT